MAGVRCLGPTKTQRVEVVVTHELADGQHLVEVLGHILLPVYAVKTMSHQLTNFSFILAKGLQRVHLHLNLLSCRVQVDLRDLSIGCRMVRAEGGGVQGGAGLH